MSAIKVLHVIGKRPVAGVGTVLLNYHQHLDTEEVQMDYFVFGEGEEDFDRSVKVLGAKVYTAPALSGRQMGETKRILKNFLKEHQGEYDVLHLHAPYIAGICLPLAEKYGIRHRVVHSHATVYAETKTKALRNQALWSVSQGKITDRIGCSEAAGKFLFGKKPYTVLKNAIEVDKYKFNASAREALRAEHLTADGLNEQETLVIGSCGRFSEQKNQTQLIDIFAAIKEKNPQAVLWLVGDGPTRREILDKIKEHKLKALNVNGKTWPAKGKEEEEFTYDVKFFGMVSNPQDFYQAMDVMVMPSLFEGLPMVGVEAQACGLPIVFSDTITTEVDIVGCPFLPLDAAPEIWADATLRLAEDHSAEQRKYWPYKTELNNQGFNIEREAKRMAELYREMVEK